MDPDTIRTVTVDSYTTLVDVGAQAPVLAEHVDGLEAPTAVSRTWRSRTIQYTMIANDIDAYRPFSELLEMALRYALESHGHEVDESVRERIRRTVYADQLAVFDDVRPGLERLVSAGYPVYIVSNGDPGMLDHLVEAADLGGIIEGAISADDVGTYKPDPRIYRHAADRTGTAMEHMLHVSGGSLRDVWGANNAGMRTAWLHRPGSSTPREYLGRGPDWQVENFIDLAERLPG